MNRDMPIIKTFTHNGRFYVYDIYTNRLLGVNKDVYFEIHELMKIGITGYKKSSRSDKK